MLPPVNERITHAAEDIEALMFDMHDDGKSVHADTCVSTCAAIVGEAVLRATYDNEPLYALRGSILRTDMHVFIDESKTGNILDYLRYTAKECGLPDSKFPNIGDIYQATAMQAGKGGALPALTVPQNNHPRIPAPQAAAQARETVLSIYQNHRLAPNECILAATMALCRILLKVKGAFSSDIAFRLALETLVGMAKMHPVSATVNKQAEGAL